MYTVVGVDGREYGPVDMAALQEWIEQGRVTATTMLIDPISGQRGPASSFVAVQPLFARVSNHAGNFAPPKYSHYVDTRHHPLMASKSKIAAALFAFFLGTLGIHQFYLGKTGLGIAMLLITVLTCGVGSFVTAIWAIIDGIIYLTGGGTDSEGAPLRD